jgi:RNase P/RNase MRP subunit POP5
LRPTPIENLTRDEVEKLVEEKLKKLLGDGNLEEDDGA